MAFKFLYDDIYTETALVESTQTDFIDTTFMDKVSAQVEITTAGSVSWTGSLQGSNDGVTWVDTQTPTNITGTVNLIFSIADATSRYYRISLVRTGGTITRAAVRMFAKG